MKYKVGDKVKIVEFYHEYVIGETAKIISIYSGPSDFAYTLKWDKVPKDFFETMPVYEYEIALAVQKGEQLLFDFMKGE